MSCVNRAVERKTVYCTLKDLYDVVTTLRSEGWRVVWIEHDFEDDFSVEVER